MRFITLLSLSLSAVGVFAVGCGGSVIDTSGTGGTTSTTTTTGPRGFDSCTGPEQCVLVNKGCCGGCGTQTLDGVVAVNRDKATDYQQSVCPDDVACPACVATPDPNLFAYCDSGTCRAADVRTHEVSACTTNAECHLRYGAACCQPCDGDASTLVSVSAGNNLGDLVCGPDDACPKCAVQFPLDSGAICNAGHCAVVFAGGGG